MLLIGKILLDGTIFSVLASIFILASLYNNPRIWLQDYPKDIQASVPPKTEKEKRLSLVFGIPFLILLAGVPLVSTFSLKNQMDGQVPFGSLFLNAAGVAFIFNLVDWLILDWLIFCTLTPVGQQIIPCQTQTKGVKHEIQNEPKRRRENATLLRCRGLLYKGSRLRKSVQ